MYISNFWFLFFSYDSGLSFTTEYHLALNVLKCPSITCVSFTLTHCHDGHTNPSKLRVRVFYSSIGMILFFFIE